MSGFDPKDSWNNYMMLRKEVYETLSPDHVNNNIISETNWVMRSQLDRGIRVEPGDICFFDFGQAYLNEVGYQHMGLVMSICARKALVIPMTSNEATFANAFDPEDNPDGARFLMRLGQPKGMNRPSVLFLNDIRYVNTARVIRKVSHIDATSEIFRTVQSRMMYVLFNNIDE